MHQHVPEAGIQGFLFPPIPYEENGGDGHDFPKGEQAEVIPSKHHPQRAPHIQESSHMLAVFPHVQRIEDSEESHDDEYVSHC